MGQIGSKNKQQKKIVKLYLIYLPMSFFFLIENKKLFTCINESTAVVECAKVRPRKREKSMKFAEVIFKPWPCKY